MIRDATGGDPASTGYHFNNGNSLKISVGGVEIFNEANAAKLQIEGGVASKTLIRKVEHIGTKDSDGSYTKTISATFAQTQPQGSRWNGTVSGSFKGTTISPSNVYVRVSGSWKLGTAYVYKSGSWKKASGKVRVRSGGSWKG